MAGIPSHTFVFPVLLFLPWVGCYQSGGRETDTDLDRVSDEDAAVLDQDIAEGVEDSNDDEPPVVPPAELWMVTLGSDLSCFVRSLFEGDEDTFFAAGNFHDPFLGEGDGWVARFDRQGRIVWQAGVENEQRHEIFQTLAVGDADTILAGTTTDGAPDLNHPNHWVARLGPEGSLVWHLRISTSVLRSEPVRVCTTQDDHLVLTTYVATETGSRIGPWIAKLDLAGHVVWQKAVSSGPFEPRHYTSIDIRESGDGSLVAVGSVTDVEGNDQYAMVFKTDSQGEMVWMKKMMEPDTGFRRLAFTPWGDIVIFGHVSFGEEAERNILIADLDELGSLSWLKVLSGSYSVSKSAIYVAESGDIYVLVTREAAEDGQSSALLVTLSPEGHCLWQREIKVNQENTGADILMDSGGGLVVALSSINYIEDNYPLFIDELQGVLMRLPASGTFPFPCDFIQDANVPLSDGFLQLESLEVLAWDANVEMLEAEVAGSEVALSCEFLCHE